MDFNFHGNTVRDGMLLDKTLKYDCDASNETYYAELYNEFPQERTPYGR